MLVEPGERKAWAREHFRGFENVLMPSFSPNFRDLNEEGIRLDVRQSIAHGFFSSLCALDSGMTPAEQRRMLEVACDEAGKDIGISLSLAGETIDQDIALLAHAERAGATHALVTYPQDFRPSDQDQVYEFVKRIADSSNLGIVLFVSEKFSLRHLHPSGVPFNAYERLADHPNIIAMNIAGIDAGLILECFERFNDRLLVSNVNLGMLPMLVQNFDLQWSGAWTVEALQSPKMPFVNRFLDHLRSAEMEKAMDIYWRLMPALAATGRSMAPALATGTWNWSLLKFQQWMTGGNGGMTRQPCMRVYQSDTDSVRRGMAAIGIECADTDDQFFKGRT